MLGRYFCSLLSVLCLLAVLVFALSNRQSTTVSLWPFGFEIAAPLYIWTLGALAAGLLSGGFIVWMTMLQHRLAARRLGKDVALLGDKVQALEAELATFRARAGNHLPLLSGVRWPVLNWPKSQWRFWKKS